MEGAWFRGCVTGNNQRTSGREKRSWSQLVCAEKPAVSSRGSSLFSQVVVRTEGGDELRLWVQSPNGRHVAKDSSTNTLSFESQRIILSAPFYTVPTKAR